jgi:regulator of sigma E protease
MEQIFAFVIVIGVIIFIHEFGHFSTAKFFGIPVATFSLGFGPRLFGFRHKETEYKVSAIPLGGYVKIHGMEDQEAAPDDPNSFYNKPRWQRFLVLFMGVGFNMILAILLISIAYTRGIEVAQSSMMNTRIGAVAPNSPAATAGLQPGDIILEMNGKKIDSWREVTYNTLLNPNEKMRVVVKRENQILQKDVQLAADENRNLGQMGISPSTDVIIADVVKGKPAERAGLKIGDRIVSINGEHVYGTESTPALIQKSQGKPVEMVVLRNGQTVTLHIQPEKVQTKDAKGNQENRWILGFSPGEPTVLKKLPLGEAIKESFRTCKEHVRLNAIFLSKLFRGKLSLKATSGPFDIAKMSDAALKTSLSTFLLFIGTISFDIGLINLLPIPALDGGHILFLVVEGITRRELSIKVKERMSMIGFAFLICVMVVVLYYDLLRTGPIQKLIESLGMN